MNPASHLRPRFLDGTFSWLHLGYAHAEPPPLNLLSADALDAENPWIVVAAVLEHAKRGDHDQIPRLARWCDSECRQGFEVAAIELVGNAGRLPDLEILRSVMAQGTDAAAAYSAKAASMSGRRDLVPSMLGAWKRVSGRDHHDMIGNSISRLLERPGGEIAAQAGSYPITEQGRPRHPTPASEFEQEVRRRFADLSSRVDPDQALWEGEPVDVAALAAQMFAAVRTPGQLLPGLFSLMRQKFEVGTGIDCSSWYRKGILQPLNAAVVLESFVDSRSDARYAVGTRHFFGHPIPAS